MQHSALSALSPLDGRYHNKVSALRPIMSEYGLIYYRVLVEIRWLITLTENPTITEAPGLTLEQHQTLEKIITEFNVADAEQIKTIETTTNHDVKAVEYFIQEKIKHDPTLIPLIPFIHFGCTSEDINNLAYSLMLKTARDDVMLPAMQDIISHLTTMAKEYADTAMLARTHGQPATPTTLGKEIANVQHRLKRQYQLLKDTPISAKFNGAVGNFNAHFAAYPDVDWPTVSLQFIENMSLSYNAFTTQIEPHDHLAELLQTLSRFNTILIDLNRDMWSYISLNYFTQQTIASEVGSSTMPHKVNPIDFENSEGNLGMANALAIHMASKLPLSRWQRDLTDSTVLRNLGSVFGYSLIAFQATLKGLNKLTANPDCLNQDLEAHWEVLTEAIQTVLRRYGHSDAYEQLKNFSRGEKMDQKMIKKFINQLDLPKDAKQTLKSLIPQNYLGYAVELSRHLS